MARHFRRFLGLKLQLVEFGIQAAGFQQVVVLAPLDDGALAYDKDDVGPTNGRKPVGDYNACFPVHQSIQCVEYQPLGKCV